MEHQTFESFLAWMVFAGVGLTVAVYAVGAYILSGFGSVAIFLYLAYCACIEASILRGSCRRCRYYDKLCALGRGKLCSLLFKKGDPQEFLKREVSYRDIIPDVLVPVIPLVGGVVLLLMRLDWMLVGAMVLLALLASVGTGLFRDAVACRHCVQWEFGCPAQELLSKQRG